MALIRQSSILFFFQGGPYQSFQIRKLSLEYQQTFTYLRENKTRIEFHSTN